MKIDQDLHVLTGAYALDALTEEEQRIFTTHLGRCDACTLEVAEFAATAARLAVAVGLPVPPRMKPTVMHRIDEIRQMPPPSPAGPTVGRATIWRRRSSPFVVAASLVAAAAFGAVALWQHEQILQARTEAHQASRLSQETTAVLAAPDARTVHGTTGGGTVVSVVTSPRLNKSVFISSGLPELPAGKAYQMWFDDHGTVRSACLFHKGGAVLMEGDPSQALAVALTIEPASGSPKPTTSPLVHLNLNA